MEKLPHYHFPWIVYFQKQRYHKWEMLPLETKLSGGKLLPQSDLGGGGGFIEEMSCRRYDKECKEQKVHHSYKTGTWNVRTLNQGGKLENLKKEMQKNEVSVKYEYGTAGQAAGTADAQKMRFACRISKARLQINTHTHTHS
jgi:hypothetical protein